MTYAIAILEDPGARRVLDLAAAVADSRRARLAVVVEAAPAAEGAGEAVPGTDGDALSAACAATFGAPVRAGRFRVAGARRQAGATPVITAAEAKNAIEARCGASLVVVGVVSVSTLPLWEALHHDERTRPAPKIGFTPPLLDANWNLAQKLLADGKLSLHEHSLMLGRRLGRRLDLFLSEHARRGVSGATGV